MTAAERPEIAVADPGAADVLAMTEALTAELAGTRQHEAQRFYRRHGFVEVDRFAPYEASASSVCIVRHLARPLHP